MEAFGTAVILEPRFATMLARGVLQHGASESQKSELIPPIAKGCMKLAFQAKIKIGQSASVIYQQHDPAP
ncbi:hypothetical protein [Bradyrhizobium sp. I1.14.4]|uniref:hypothetical protein n=1 Tax=unclassified Bradyrhizobium TaxID=2631580 RepID=UPI003D23BB6A